MTKSMFEMVKEFHSAFLLPSETVPELPSKQSERDLRIDLMDEEYYEYLAAEEENDIVAIADALADIIYIACGTALSYGIDLDKVFEEVHRSNMAKLGPDGKPIYREDGKVKKPNGWMEPDIKGVLGL